MSSGQGKAIVVLLAFMQCRAEVRRTLQRSLPEADLEDCLQDTVVRLLEGHVDPPTRQPVAYFSRIARRIAIDRYRKHHREINFDAAPEVLELEQVNANPELSLSHSQQRQLVHLTLAKLQPRAQRALTLQYFSEMNYQEIGATMNISPHTVEKHIARAKSRFHRLFKTSITDLI